MTTEKRIEKAKELFASGYNCAQAVFLAFADDYGIGWEEGLKLTFGLAGGFGRMREVCGAVSGAILLLGLEQAPDSVDDKAQKDAFYENVRAFIREFKESEDSIVCRDLLALDADGNETPETPAISPCPRLVERAARMLAERQQR